jgi:hypothetical protein
MFARNYCEPIGMKKKNTKPLKTTDSHSGVDTFQNWNNETSTIKYHLETKSSQNTRRSKNYSSRPTPVRPAYFSCSFLCRTTVDPTSSAVAYGF